MKTYLLALITVVLSVTYIQKANAQCGTILPDEYQQFDEKLKQYKLASRTASSTPVVISVSIHVVSLDNTDYLAQSRVIAAFDKLNRDYAPVNISFQVCVKDVINDPANWAFYSLNEPAVVSKSFVPNTINLYIVGMIYLEGFGQACGYAYYPSSNRDIIFISNDCFDDEVTLPHEVGHFFNLKHTHETRDGVELVNRSNCNTAGDGFCDTQADPGLSNNNVNASCAYTGSATDPVGTPYQPPVHNYMSYTRRSCANEFTPQQYQEIRSAYDFSKTHLNILNVSYTQTTDSLCTGGSATFTVTGGSNFLWPDGSTNSSYTKSFTSSQSIDVSFTTGACQTVKRFNLYVYPYNNTVELKATAGMCPGASTEVYVYESVPGIKYQLKINGINIGTPAVGNGGKLTLNTGAISATSTIEVWGEVLSKGCSYKLSQTVSVFIFSSPDPNKNIVPTTYSLCKNSGILSINLPLSQSGIYYQLVANGIDVGTPIRGNGNTIQFYNVPIPATTLFTVKATNSCETITLNSSANVFVQIYANSNTVITPQDPIVCKRGSTMINVQSEVGITYQLQQYNSQVNVGSPVDGTGGIISLPTGPISTATDFRVYTYNPTGCNRVINKKITIGVENTVVSFSIAPIGINTGQTVDFINTSNTTQHVWKYEQDGVNQTVSALNMNQVPYNIPGTYQVKLIGTSALGCVDSMQKNIQVGAPTPAGPGEFCKTFNLSDGKYIVLEQEMDKFGNTYICGYYLGWNYQGDSFGMFVMKINDRGVVEWTKTAMPGFNGDPKSYATALAVDEDGNCYVAINYRSDRVIIDGVYIGGTGGNSNSTFAILKFNSAGTLLWNYGMPKNTNTGSFVSVPDIAISKNKEIYFTCVGDRFNGNFVFKNTTFSFYGFYENKLIEIDSLGNFKSSQPLKYGGDAYFLGNRNSSYSTNGTTHYVSPRISFDPDDNLILSGTALIRNNASMQFGNVIYQAPGITFFAMKYNKAGQWTALPPMFTTDTDIDGSDLYIPTRTNVSPDMAMDSQGNKYLVVSYVNYYYYGANYPDYHAIIGSTDLIVNRETSFLIKTDANNQVLWYSKSPGGLMYKSVSVNKDDHPVIFGISDTLAQFSSANGSVTGIPSSANGMFWAEYDENGNRLWARALGMVDQPFTMALDPCGNISMIGSSTNVQAGADNITGTTPRLFMVNYSPDGNCSTLGCAAIFSRAKNTYCDSDSISVSYQGRYLNASSGNTFTLELSDASGSFSNPTILNSVASVNNGVIKAKFPSGLPAGSYKVRVNSSNPAVIGESSAVFQLSIPPVSSIPAFLLDQNPICDNDSLTIEIPNSLNGYQYQLLKNNIPSTNIIIGDGGVVELKIPAPVNHTVLSFKVTQGNSCPAYSPETEIITLTPPAAVLSAQDTLYRCDRNLPAVLTCSAADTYLWSNGETGSSLSVTTDGNYSVKVTDVNGCYTLSDTVYIKSIYPYITVYDDDQHLCYTDMIMLNASPGLSYTWNTGETSRDIQINTPGKYAVRVSYANCISTSDTVEITSSPNYYDAILTPDSTSRCEGGVVLFNSAFATGNTWSTGETTQQISVNTTGSVTLTITDEYGCSADSYEWVQIYPRPDATLSMVQNYLVTTPDGISYNWYKDGQLIAQTSTSGIPLTDLGDYQVEVTDWYGCSAISEVYTVTFITNVNSSLSETIQVYPNPFHDQLIIDVGNNTIEQLELYDVTGKKIWKTDYITNPHTYELVSDPSVPSGLYMLRIISHEGELFIKVLKH